MKRKGFTLIELLVVIVILAIIAFIVVPMVLNKSKDAKKEAIPVGPTYYYAFGEPTTSSTTDYTILGKNVFARLGSDGSKGVCINDGGLFCINANDKDNSIVALKAHFGESSCTDDGSRVFCNSGAFYCSALSSGYVSCYDYSTGESCYAYADGSGNCY